MRPVHTYSIVARDPATGQLGVAVQSHYFSVGSVVPWVEPGVGAVAMQSYLHLAYGPDALALLRAGRSATDALAELVSRDPEQDLRQLAIVDARGNVAAHTGARCIEAAGHTIGNGYSTQANLMLNAGVWPAMADAYKSATGDLADRLMTALEAGEAAGGDLRGQQSAALVIVSGERQAPGAGRIFDLRVEDHPAPLAELRRLLTLARAYRLVEDADTAVGQGRFHDAAVAYKDAVALAPHIAELKLMAGLALLPLGEETEGGTLIDEALLADPKLAVLIPRLAALGLAPDNTDRWRAGGAPSPS
jgi:uncharacterized Ntn-hydrolase superfamily protein